MNIGSLTIQMSADVARLRKDMEEAKAVVKNSMGDIEKAVNIAKTAFVAYTGIAGVNQLKNMVTGSIEGAAALSKLSKETGTSVEGLTALAAVGKQSGTSAESITGAMQKMSKVMTTSGDETKGAGAALKSIGIDYQSFIKLSPDEQMLKVADSLGQFEGGAGKTAAAMALFGEQGAAMIPFLDDLAAKGELVGKTTQEQAEAAERYTRTMKQLENGGKGLEKTFAMALLPVMDETARAFNGLIGGTGGLMDKMKALTADGTLETWARGGVTAVTYLIDGVQYTVRIIDLVGKGIYAAIQQVSYLVDGAGKAVAAISKGDLSGAVDAVTGSFKNAGEAGAEFGGQMSAAFTDDTLGSKMRAQIEQVQKAGTASQEVKKKLDFREVMGAQETEFDKIIQKVHELTATQQQSLNQTEQMSAAQGEAMKWLVKLRDGHDHMSVAHRQRIALAFEEALKAEKLVDAHKKELGWQEEASKANADSIDGRDKSIQTLKDQIKAQQESNELAGLSVEAMAALTRKRVADAAAELDRRAALADSSMLGDDIVKQYKDQAQAMRDLEAAKSGGKAVADFMGANPGQILAQGFDAASKSLLDLVSGMGQLNAAQQQYEAAKVGAKGNAEQLAAIERKHAADQVGSYATLASTAKGFFAEGSKGYKTLQAAEQTFRAFEMAMALKNAAEKMGLIGVETTAKVAGVATQTAAVATGEAAATTAAVAGEAERNAVKTPGVFMAFLSQLGPFGMAAAGVAIAAVLGSSVSKGSSSPPPTNSGTGTVLGDRTAQSQSIGKGLESLSGISNETMKYSAMMAASLRNIESGIGGMADLIVRSGAVATLGQDVKVGFQRDDAGNAISKYTGIMSDMSSKIPVIGSVLGGLQKAIGNGIANLFGTKTSVVGQGISAGPQSLTSVTSGGFQAQMYADVERKKQVLGITTSTSVSTQTSAASDELQKQFGLVLGGVVNSIKLASGPLGVALGDVQKRLDAFTVNIGRVELKGLTGQQISDKLTAVFGAAGDSIAKAALGGLEDFQKVGEGYLQTVVRVAGGMDMATQMLDTLGVQAIALTDIGNKQGDVTAEVVRQSLMAKEGLSGVADMLATSAGSAADMIKTYTGLAAVRTQLVALGLSGAAVGRNLIAGAGDMQGLSDGVKAFTARFGTAKEQLASQSTAMQAQFAALGVAMPKSAVEFKALVKAQDTSTEAGQRMLGALLSLSDGFGSLLDAVQTATGGIDEEVRRIKGLTAGPVTLASMQAQFTTQTAMARSGDAQALANLPKLSQALLDLAANQASTAQQLAGIQASTAASLSMTSSIIKQGTGITGPTTVVQVPAFAAGGDFVGGLRLVGENGPELEATGPARIFNAAQTSQILSGAGSGGGGDSAALVAEVRSLRQEVAALRADNSAENKAIAGHVATTARILVRVTPTGESLSVTSST